MLVRIQPRAPPKEDGAEWRRFHVNRERLRSRDPTARTSAARQANAGIFAIERPMRSMALRRFSIYVAKLMRRYPSIPKAEPGTAATASFCSMRYSQRAVSDAAAMIPSACRRLIASRQSG